MSIFSLTDVFAENKLFSLSQWLHYSSYSKIYLIWRFIQFLQRHQRNEVCFKHICRSHGAVINHSLFTNSFLQFHSKKCWLFFQFYICRLCISNCPFEKLYFLTKLCTINLQQMGLWFSFQKVIEYYCLSFFDLKLICRRQPLKNLTNFLKAVFHKFGDKSTSFIRN